ncbi:MAG TPA: DEAD/DEAH box helicase family protein, partial [Burkholderiales bacterium]|nr:DEAD/DEAH box helicase family protein [Burkholderiales bacterium]
MIIYNISTEFASQSPELKGELPLCSYIDKTICGCGLTTMAIENNKNTIIAMPTINLVNNKSSQYPNNRFKYKVFGLIGGISKSDIEVYVNTCLKLKHPIKILTTYDSFYKLEKYFNLCDIIIDESNRLLSSAHLKISNKTSSKAVDVISELFKLTEKYKDRVSFISATPIPLTYMPKWMEKLNQIKLNWSNTIKVKPILFERTYPYKALIDELILPIEKKGYININGVIVKKLIIFLNSVTDIMNVLRNAELNSNDVRLLIADNDVNSNKIKNYKRLSFKDNQETKSLSKYTFATSCAFDGIDLYDDESINVVVSNVNKHFTMIDIATDLKQAVSRQRMKTNIHYNKYIYIYNKIIFEKDEQILIDKINKLKDNLGQSIQLYEIAKNENLKDGFMVDNDFIAYTNYLYDKDTYVINENLFN